ncbi:hypothetical protein Gotri_010977 [Gossypium trilobum]|uniref:U-box domain-containing protein n=1 Tax=Gossypium trilobum TaxID=34281 RepID=A0A7J9ES29_9ROSI|nr:hypothetical protein [Gossypium trilobum]
MEVKRRTARNLVSKLSSVSDETRTDALCELRLISKHDPDSRPLIADAGASCAATLHSLLIAEDTYRPIIGAKRDILYTLLSIITDNNAPPRSIKDALKALFGVALYPLNRASLVGLGAVPALVSLIVRDARTGIVEDATAVLAQIAGCEESEEAMMKAGGVRVLGDLLDEGTGASERIRENAVAALLNLARCGGEKGRKEVKEMGAKVMEGISDLTKNGSIKGKTKAAELLKIVVDGYGNQSEVRDFRFNTSSDFMNHSI